MTKEDVKQTIKNLILKLGRFPKISELATELNVAQYRAQQIFASLVQDGFLIRAGNWYRLSEAPNKPEKIENKDVLSKQDFSIAIIRAIMAFIGICAAFMSVYYTAIWMIEFLPFFLAVLLSLIMIGFSVIIFEVLILFFSSQIIVSWLKWPISCFFLLLWMVVASFSMGTTVAGQYNRHVALKKEIEIQNISEAVSNKKLMLIQERKMDLKKRIADQRMLLEKAQNSIQNVDSIEIRAQYGKVWYVTQDLISTIQKNLDQLLVELENQREKERALLDSGAVGVLSFNNEVPDFYSWIAHLFRSSRDSIQFWSSLFPAIFIDLISPIAIAIAMFLKNRNGQ
jgi:hypothetical protein